MLRRYGRCVKSTVFRTSSSPGKNSSKEGASSDIVVKTRPVEVICVSRARPSESMASIILTTPSVRRTVNDTPENS